MKNASQPFQIVWLSKSAIAFPNPAITSPEGILAAGGDLSPQRLIQAYKLGIFPWFNPEDPIVWWSPDPRFVLPIDNLKVSKSMRPYFNQKKFHVTLDTNFEAVIKNCSTVQREGQSGGTWITDDMMEGYIALHQKGLAHSVEVWKDSELVGGLYGISIGKCFFGESMFSKESNASKFGFITLARRLKELGYWLIDCQQPTGLLESLGAVNIPRADFLTLMKRNEQERTYTGNWGSLLEKNPEEKDMGWV